MDWRITAPVVFAPFAGSTAGVLVRRLPRHQAVALSRSACERCGHAVRIRDLLPIVSFLILRGRCRDCGAPIAPFHLGIELAAVAVALPTTAVAATPAESWAGGALAWALLAAGVIDARHLVLPDAVTLPLVLAGLCWTAWAMPDRLFDHALATACAYTAFRLVALVHRRLRGHEGLGGGDAKLLAALGAWLGTAALPWVVFVAALLGLLVAAARHLRGRRVTRRTALPFGPCLAVAGWLAWLHGAAVAG